MADRQPFAVGREAVVVVTKLGVAHVESDRLAPRYRQSVDASLAVVVELLPVARPVGGLEGVTLRI